MTESTYPEHDKLKALDGKNETVGEFIEWLSSKGYQICELVGDYREIWSPVGCSVERWIADFFEIDRDSLEAEKRDMLDRMRKANADAAARKLVDQSTCEHDWQHSENASGETYTNTCRVCGKSESGEYPQ